MDRTWRFQSRLLCRRRTVGSRVGGRRRVRILDALQTRYRLNGEIRWPPVVGIVRGLRTDCGAHTVDQPDDLAVLESARQSDRLPRGEYGYPLGVWSGRQQRHPVGDLRARSTIAGPRFGVQSRDLYIGQLGLHDIAGHRVYNIH